VDQITGKTLLAWGYKPGGWFGASTSPSLRRRCAPRVRWPIG
jgi:hypothetical protein